MVINQSKTKFMVINGSNIDRSPLISGSLTVDNCEAYTFLGSVFTQDGKIESALKCHLVSKQPHVMKFRSFVMKNCDFPFWVKQVVCEAALFSSVLYGCESWLCNGAKVIEPVYRSLIKVLLGVRSNTANDLCLIELGWPSLSGYHPASPPPASPPFRQGRRCEKSVPVAPRSAVPLSDTTPS